MSDRIRLHPQHGLNPTMPVCIFCGRETGEIALLGAAYDGEAPMHMAMNDQPCDKCKSEWAAGIAIMEFDGQHNTGRVLVVTEDAIRRWLEGSGKLEQVLKVRGVRVSPEVFEQIMPAKEG